MKGRKGAAINLFSRLAGIFSGLSWRNSWRSSGDNSKRKNWWGGFEMVVGTTVGEKFFSFFKKI